MEYIKTKKTDSTFVLAVKKIINKLSIAPNIDLKNISKELDVIFSSFKVTIIGDKLPQINHNATDEPHIRTIKRIANYIKLAMVMDDDVTYQYDVVKDDLGDMKQYFADDLTCTGDIKLQK